MKAWQSDKLRKLLNTGWRPDWGRNTGRTVYSTAGMLGIDVDEPKQQVRYMPYGVEAGKVYDIDPTTGLPKKYWYDLITVNGVFAYCIGVPGKDHVSRVYVVNQERHRVYSYEKDLDKGDCK